MPAGLGSLVGVLAAVVEQTHDAADVCSVRAACEEVRHAGVWVPAVTVEVRAHGHAAAAALGEGWDLVEEPEEVRGLPGGPRLAWRTWSGWVPRLAGAEGSGTRRVWARVTGSERAPALAPVPDKRLPNGAGPVLTGVR